jgi:hypothetical protein
MKKFALILAILFAVPFVLGQVPFSKIKSISLVQYQIVNQTIKGFWEVVMLVRGDVFKASTCPSEKLPEGLAVAQETISIATAPYGPPYAVGKCSRVGLAYNDGGRNPKTRVFSYYCLADQGVGGWVAVLVPYTITIKDETTGQTLVNKNLRCGMPPWGVSSDELIPDKIRVTNLGQMSQGYPIAGYGTNYAYVTYWDKGQLKSVYTSESYIPQPKEFPPLPTHLSIDIANTKKMTGSDGEIYLQNWTESWRSYMGRDMRVGQELTVEDHPWGPWNDQVLYIGIQKNDASPDIIRVIYDEEEASTGWVGADVCFIAASDEQKGWYPDEYEIQQGYIAGINDFPIIIDETESGKIGSDGRFHIHFKGWDTSGVGKDTHDLNLQVYDAVDTLEEFTKRTGLANAAIEMEDVRNHFERAVYMAEDIGTRFNANWASQHPIQTADMPEVDRAWTGFMMPGQKKPMPINELAIWGAPEGAVEAEIKFTIDASIYKTILVVQQLGKPEIVGTPQVTITGGQTGYITITVRNTGGDDRFYVDSLELPPEVTVIDYGGRVFIPAGGTGNIIVKLVATRIESMRTWSGKVVVKSEAGNQSTSADVYWTLQPGGLPTPVWVTVRVYVHAGIIPIEGATVNLGGIIKTTDSTGMTPSIVVQSGTHRLRVEKEGYPVWEQDVSITGSTTTIDVDLTKVPTPPPTPVPWKVIGAVVGGIGGVGAVGYALSKRGGGGW